MCGAAKLLFTAVLHDQAWQRTLYNPAVVGYRSEAMRVTLSMLALLLLACTSLVTAFPEAEDADTALEGESDAHDEQLESDEDGHRESSFCMYIGCVLVLVLVLVLVDFFVWTSGRNTQVDSDRHAGPKTTVAAALKSIDTNGDGKISHAELHARIVHIHHLDIKQACVINPAPSVLVCALARTLSKRSVSTQRRLVVAWLVESQSQP